MKNAIIEFYNFFHIVKKDEILDEVKDIGYANSVKQRLETVNGDITIHELERNVLNGTNKHTKDFLLSILAYFKELLTVEFIKLRNNKNNNNNKDEELGQETAGGGVSLKSIFEEHIDPKKKYFINKKKLIIKNLLYVYLFHLVLSLLIHVLLYHHLLHLNPVLLR